MSKKANPLEVVPGVWKSIVLQCQTVSRIVNERLVNEMREARMGLDPRQGWVLMAAKELEASQSMIAEALGINPNVMVGVVDSLEHKGLVRRRQAPNRREHRLEITIKGGIKLAEMLDDWDGRKRRIFQPLTSEEVDRLSELARKLIEGYYTSEPAPSPRRRKSHLVK